jgi:hypothetical protein
MSVVVDDRVHAQRMANLAKGDAVRLWRAEQKRLMTVERAVALLKDPPEQADRWKVGQLLQAIPQVGPKKVAVLLSVSRISPTTTLGNMSPRQRLDLSVALEMWQEFKR